LIAHLALVHTGDRTDLCDVTTEYPLDGLRDLTDRRLGARRIDRQLIGRCARQGDRGSCGAVLSWEDALLEIQRKSWLAALLRRRRLLATPPGQWLSQRLLRRAQRRVERAHFKMRKELLKVDQQLGDLLSFSGYVE